MGVDSTPPAPAAAAAQSTKTDRDGDSDSETKRAYDRDDHAIRHFGHSASATDRRIVTGLLNRYYAAIAAGDFTTVCSLIDGDLAHALAAQDNQRSDASHGGAGGCAAVVSKLLTSALGRSRAALAAVTVIGVRVDGSRGVGLLRMGTSELRYIPVDREDGRWRIEVLSDSGLD